MVVLNQSQSNSGNGFDPQKVNSGQDNQQSSQTSSKGQMDKFNELLTNVNKLLENDLVQKRIADKGQQGRQVMGNGGQVQGQPQPQPQNMNQNAVQNPTQPTQQPTPNGGTDHQENGGNDRDLDLKDYFADKIQTEKGRQELSDQIGELTQYLDPDATLEQIQEEVVSEEFVEQVEQLKEAGMI